MVSLFTKISGKTTKGVFLRKILYNSLCLQKTDKHKEGQKYDFHFFLVFFSL